MKISAPTACGLVALVLLGTSLPRSAVASEASISGVQKVIQMLTNMKTKGNEELNAEQVAYAKFNQWCLDESAKLGKEIKKNKAEIESLTEEMNKLEAQAAELKDQVAQLTADVSTHEADMKKATAERASDRKAALAEEKDYSESVDALGRAIAFLKAQDYDRTGKGAAALLQLSSADRIPVKVKSIVSAFLGMISAGKGTADGKQEPSTDYQPPEANAYEFQSTSIVEMLKKLEDEFREKLGECQKEEMNSKHAYDMIMMDLKDSVENAERDSKAKAEESHRKISKSAEHKKQLAATSSMKEANEMTLKGLTQECFEKGLSFEEKQKLRTEEHEAIEKAIEILSSPEVAGSAEKYLGLAQRTPRATALVQLDRNAQAQESRGIRGKLQAFLAAEGQRLKSKPLLLLAEQAAVDPFAKVKKMIEEMITRLNQEAHEDAEHEGFCDKEMGASKVTRNKLSETIDGLTADVENGRATIAMLTKEIAELEQDVSELRAAMKESTDLRFAEKKKNEETVSDAVDASKAVAAAVAVLKDFYKKSSMATGFVQLAAGQPYGSSKKEAGGELGVSMGSEEWKLLGTDDFDKMDKGHKKGMQTFGAVYQGQQDEAGGVLAMLDVIASDFATLKADTESSEAISAKAYEDFMNGAKKDIAVKTRKKEMNAQDQLSAQSRMNDDVADLKFTQDKLLAADRYYETLVPQCLDKGMTFGERAKARKEEIESLKQALEILSSEDVA